MPDIQSKYHHLIPQTYMSAWANSSGTLKIEYKNKRGTIVPRNKANIAGITDYHSIRAGMPICTNDDALLIFQSLSGYKVEYDGLELKNPLDFNANYYDFDNWSITRTNGTPVSKKHIRNEIEQVKIRDIEKNWSLKYENPWNSTREKIEKTVLKTKDGCISAFDKEYLMRFFTALDWRGFCSNQLFEETFQKITNGLFDEIDIPENARFLPSLKTASDELRHVILLHYFRQYLNDYGVIYKDAMANLANTNFHFLISDGPTLFFTSDTPSFIHKRKDGQLIGLLAITPRILMAKGRCTTDYDKFYVTHITDEKVIEYNEAIQENAEEFIIHPF